MDLKSIARGANDLFGKGSAIQFNPSELKKNNYKGIHSGSYMLNHLLTNTHNVGWVHGKIYEVFGPEGCLDKDTLVDIEYLDENTWFVKCRTKRIEDLYHIFNNKSDKSETRYNIKSFDNEGKLVTNKILDVVSSGDKECFRVVINRNSLVYRITATGDHKFYIGGQKYLSLSDLKVGDGVYLRDKKIDTISMGVIGSIESVGIRETYDIKCSYPYNNFFANGVAVHNSGKTTLVLHAISEAQKVGEYCAFIDTEHALDMQYAQSVGVDIGEDKFILSQPTTGEDAFELINYYAKNGIKLIVVDSVATMTPKAVLEGNVGDSHVAQLARLMSQELSKTSKFIPESDSILIFTNQIRQKVGVVLGSNEITPGGNALRFYVSGARIDVRTYRADKLVSSKKLSDKKDGIRSEESGINMTVKSVKNKIAPPFRSIKYAIDYGVGLNKKVDIIRFGLLNRVVTELTDKKFRLAVEGEEPKSFNISTASDDVFNYIEKKSIEVYKSGEACGSSDNG